MSPEHKKKIEDVSADIFHQGTFTKGANFGYLLAAEEKDTEIVELKANLALTVSERIISRDKCIEIQDLLDKSSERETCLVEGILYKDAQIFKLEFAIKTAKKALEATMEIYEGDERCHFDHHGYCQAHNLGDAESCHVALNLKALKCIRSIQGK